LATRADYLVRETHASLSRIEGLCDQLGSEVRHIVQLMDAIGGGVLNDHAFENGYTKADMIALYVALSALPGFVIPDDVRDHVFLFLSSVQ